MDGWHTLDGTCALVHLWKDEGTEKQPQPYPPTDHCHVVAVAPELGGLGAGLEAGLVVQARDENLRVCGCVWVCEGGGMSSAMVECVYVYIFKCLVVFKHEMKKIRWAYIHV